MANFLKGRTNENLVKGHDVGATGIATGSTSQRPSDSNTGDIRFNTDNNVLEFYTGSAWGNIAQAGTVTVTKSTPVTGDGSTTVFSNFFATAPADENNVIVVVGNVIQEPDQAYTISGRDITFTSAPPNTHRVYAFEGFDSTDAS